MGMFDNYDNIPSDNRIKTLNNCNEYYDYISAGGTNTHYFSIPFDYDSIKEIELTYYQSNRLTIIKHKEDLTLINNDKRNYCCIISCKLNENETIKFNDTLLDTLVQFKVTTDKNNIYLSEAYKLYIIDKLKQKEDLNYEV